MKASCNYELVEVSMSSLVHWLEGFIIIRSYWKYIGFISAHSIQLLIIVIFILLSTGLPLLSLCSLLFLLFSLFLFYLFPQNLPIYFSMHTS